jgi:hypothetical protein
MPAMCAPRPQTIDLSERVRSVLVRQNRLNSKRRYDKMRKLWILACVLALPCVASAQWEDLNRLQAGQKIQVVEVNSKKDSGTFLSVSDKTISLQAKSGQQIIQRQDVGSVKLMENKHRLRNTAIGGVLGAGVGAGIGAAAYRECNPAQSFCIDPIGRGGEAGIFAIVGFAGGAIVGALWPSHETIYRATGP